MIPKLIPLYILYTFILITYHNTKGNFKIQELLDADSDGMKILGEFYPERESVNLTSDAWIPMPELKEIPGKEIWNRKRTSEESRLSEKQQKESCRFTKVHSLKRQLPLSFTLQYTTAVNVLINVTTIAGAITPARFTLPYCCL